MGRMLRMAADAVDDFQGKTQQRYADQREAGVDSQAVVDAVATLTASALAGLAQAAPRLRGESCCDCQCVTESGGGSASVVDEVEKAFGRLGLVQESELAALRKRVVDLEAKLSGSAAKAKPAAKQTSRKSK